jgi:hypothetical protein
VIVYGQFDDVGQKQAEEMHADARSRADPRSDKRQAGRRVRFDLLAFEERTFEPFSAQVKGGSTEALKRAERIVYCQHVELSAKRQTAATYAAGPPKGQGENLSWPAH